MVVTETLDQQPESDTPRIRGEAGLYGQPTLA